VNLKSPTATLMLGALGLVLLAALGWVTLIGPAFGKISETDQARVETQDRNSAMGLQLATLRRQTADLPRLQKLARRLDQVFPPTADQPGFFAAVTEAAADAGIAERDVKVLSPSVPERLVDPAEAAAAAEEGATQPKADVGDLAVQTVTIDVAGTYDQFVALLDNLETMKRGILITSVGLNVEDESTSLVITGSTFVAPPLETPDGSEQAAAPGGAGS
jgi:Tfp pilus assembly protein PilO